MTFEIGFLDEEFNDLKDLFLLSEEYLNKKDSNTCIFKTGQIVEIIIDKIFKVRNLEKESNVYDNINYLQQNKIIPKDIYAKLELIRLTRNKAVHNNYNNQEDGIQCIYAVYTVLKWFAENYSIEKIKTMKNDIIEANNKIENYVINNIVDDIGVVDYVNDDIDEIFRLKEAFNLGQCQASNVNINGNDGKMICYDGHIYIGYTTEDGNIYKYECEESIDKNVPTRGKYILSNGDNIISKYQGYMIDYKYDGKGKLILNNGKNRYEGEFRDHKYHGYGVLVIENGTRYEGEFKDGMYHGKGKLISKGDKYQGEWINGILQGKVKVICMNGNRYEAEFKDGNISGKGRVIANNGDRYEGEWVNGKPSGKGVYIYANGNRYKGDILDGKPSGRGVYIYANGDRYEGDILDGKPSGRGKKIYADGNRYEGEFVNETPSGKGTYITSSGNIFEGEFANGRPNGKGINILNDGSRYEGEFVNGFRHGYGIDVKNDGSRYEGEFVNGRPNGYGIATHNGDRYEGEWKNGKYHGKGKLIYGKESIIQEGEFVNGNHHGIFKEIGPDYSRKVYYENGVKVDKKTNTFIGILKKFGEYGRR